MRAAWSPTARPLRLWRRRPVSRLVRGGGADLLLLHLSLPPALTASTALAQVAGARSWAARSGVRMAAGNGAHFEGWRRLWVAKTEAVAPARGVGIGSDGSDAPWGLGKGRRP